MVKLAIIIAVLAAGLQNADGAGCTEKKTLMKFGSVGKSKAKGASGCQTSCSGTPGCAFWNFAPKLGECKLRGIKSLPSKTRVSGKKDCNMLTCKSTEIDSECINYKTYLKPFVVDRMKKIGSDEACAKKCDSAYQCMFWVYWPKRQICRLSGLKRMKNKFRTSGKMSCKGACGSTPGPTLPPVPQCSDYKELNDATRLFKIGGGTGTFSDNEATGTPSPDWQGAGYYRFVPPAGTRLSAMGGFPTEAGNGCQSKYGVGTNSSLPTEYNDETSFSYLYYGSHDGYSDVVTDDPYNTVTVTKCPGDFYVYWLVRTSAFMGLTERYCADP